MLCFSNAVGLAALARRTAPLCATKPPEVKSSFYKRPSKAIEKGGGFYVPGLRGWRLRTAVGSVLLGLLVANHISAGKPAHLHTCDRFPNDDVLKAPPRSFTVSETIASLSAATVLLSSLWSAWLEGRDAEAPVPASAATPAQPAQDFEETGAAREAPVAALSEQRELQWASDTLFDLCRADSLIVASNAEVLHSFGASHQDDLGEVVRRVSKEGRDIFIEDSSTLPEGVGFPFLDASRVSAVVVARGGDRGAVVVSADLDKRRSAFDLSDRMWIGQVAQRLIATLE